MSMRRNSSLRRFVSLFKGPRRDSYDLALPENEGEIMNIGTPTGFQHHIHIGYDSHTGTFVGLPDPWKLWLANSKLT